jgi:outer membrane protein
MAERRRRPWVALAALCAGLAQGNAWADWSDDPLSTARRLPLPVGERLASLELPCGAGRLPLPLTPLDAVRQALCQHPQTRQAWAAVEAQAAAVGLGQSAYWPRVNAAASLSRVHVGSEYPDQPALDSSFDGSSSGQSLGLDWVLYDFGLRAASLRRERALFIAACASQNETVLAVFLDAVRAYFAAEQAQASLAMEAQAEQAARQSAEVAQAKVAAGVGLEADRLQAQTAYAQARLDRIRAQEKQDGALGTLAAAMGLRPGTPITLPPPVDAMADDAEAGTRIDTLMERAQQLHPRIAAARAQLQAAQEAVAAARAGGRPSIAFSAFAERSDTPIDRVSSRQQIESSSLGLRLSAPLFEGFGRSYRIRQAEALRAGREAELGAARQDVAQAVWESYIAVRGSAEARSASRSLLDSAGQSYELASGRYRAGVGNILELLRAQSDLAAARQQEVMMRTRWRLARLELAASLGQIDFGVLREAD